MIILAAFLTVLVLTRPMAETQQQCSRQVKQASLLVAQTVVQRSKELQTRNTSVGKHGCALRTEHYKCKPNCCFLANTLPINNALINDQNQKITEFV